MTAKIYHYVLYGLQIGSNAPIHGLTEITPRRIDDLLITDGAMPSGLESQSKRWKPNNRFAISADAPSNMEHQILQLSDDGAYLQWRYGNDILIVFALDGTRIWVQWSSEMDPSLRAFNLFGPAMGMILKLRGFTTLHASVIDIGGKAIAFAGESGSGKSTLAAAFEQAGYSILSDDLCVLIPDSSGFLIPPGAPRIRLMPDAATALYGDDSEFDPAPDSLKMERRLRWVTTPTAQEQVPLVSIYYLSGRDSEPSVKPVPQREALFLLLKTLYMQFIGDEQMRLESFRGVSELLQQVPVEWLVVTQGHNKLKKLCRDIALRHS